MISKSSLDSPALENVSVGDMLPESWHKARLGELCSIITGKKDVNEGNPNGLYPFFTCARTPTRSDSYSFDTEAILIAGNGEVGKTHYYNGMFEAYQRTYVLTDFSISPRFLFFYLQTFAQDVLLKRKTGSTMPYIRKGDLIGFEVPVPPISEQAGIVTVLESVQHIKEACEQVIIATRQLKKSLLQYLFTYGPVPFDQADQVPLKETEIGLMPELWRFEGLGDHLELIRNGLTRMQNKDGVGFPITRIETISGDTINFAKAGFVEGLSEEEVAKFRLRQNDILFSHINSEPQLGRTAVYLGKPDVLIHGMNLLLLRAGKSMHPIFLDFVCQYLRRLGVFIGIASRAVGQSSINQGKLKALQVPIPSYEEQVEIAAQLATLDTKLSAEEARWTALNNLFQSLLYHLMTGKVRITE